jgi:hypothetical protein
MAAFALAVLGLLLYRERAVLLDYDWRLRWVYIAYSFLLLIAGTLLAALVWTSLMRTLGSNVSIIDHIRYYVLSQLAKRLPGTVWYIASRSYFYREHGDSAVFVTIASSLELLISCAAGALVALLFTGFTFTSLSPFYLAILTIILMAAAFASRPAFICWLLRRMGHRETPTIRYSHILQWLCAYILLWILGGAMLFLTATAVTPLRPHFFFYVVGSWSLVGVLSYAVFFLPNNLGFTEVGLSLLLANLVPSSFAVIIAVLTRFSILIYEVIIALLLITLLRFLPQKLTAR